MPFPQPASNAARDDALGPIVRPYAMTRGRTRPTKGSFDLVSIIIATRTAPAPGEGFGPEQVAIIRLCQRPLSVAEVAAHLDLPLSVVRVFLGDLLHQGLIVARQPEHCDPQYSDDILEAMLNGLRAL